MSWTDSYDDEIQELEFVETMGNHDSHHFPDRVECCPDCERPNQFGEMCPDCRENQ